MKKKTRMSTMLTIKPNLSPFEMQKCNRIIFLKKKKGNLKHNYIGARRAAYTILFLMLLIAYYCVTASHTRPPDKTASWKISFVISQSKHISWLIKWLF